MNPLSCLVIRLNERIKNCSVSIQDVQREIANMLKTQLRRVDVLGKRDKSSVVVVLPETIEIATTILSSKLEKQVETQWSLEKALLPFIGGSSWRKGDDINLLVKRADNRQMKQPDTK